MPLSVVRQTIIQNFFPYSLHIMYLVFFICGFIMLYGFYRKIESYGFTPYQFVRLLVKDLRAKLKRFLYFSVAQKKILEEKEGGLMHGAIFYGFLFLFIYTTLIFIQTDILSLISSYIFISGDFYLLLEFLGDTFGIAYIIGLLIAIYRRYAERPEKLQTLNEDHFVLSMLLWIGVSGFIVEALRISIVSTQYNSISYLGYFISLILPFKASITIYGIFWFAHMISVMVLIAATPYTKLAHVIISGLNVAVSPVKPLGKLNTPYSLKDILEGKEQNIPESPKRASDLDPVYLFMADSCTNCGRCQEVCPAFSSGRELTPRLLVRDVAKDALKRENLDVFESGALTENELWSCTMCNACVYVCPVMINQVDFVVEFRRTLVNTSKLDTKKLQFLENISRTNNPYGLPHSERMRWIRDLDVKTLQEKGSSEYLYWIGCHGSYDSRGSKVAISMVKIMKSAGLDFSVLGIEEFCTGEPVRRIGEEGRFQELALRNIETLKRYNVKKIITHCPHCYNTLKNEYKEFGLEAEIIHHTQLINQMIEEGKIKLRKIEGIVTYHDPCNLGRINGIFEEPRDVIKNSGLSIKEMKRSRYSSFCCGGGGANVWYEVPEKKKISVIRSEEAVSTGADELVVACPFCMTMFEDAMNTLQNGLKVIDVAEIVASNIEEKA